MLKYKRKFIIPLASLSLLVSIPWIVVSCVNHNELTKESYWSKSENKNGLKVLRLHSPNFGSFSEGRLWGVLNLFSLLERERIIDDNFKTKYSDSFDEIKKIEKQYYEFSDVKSDEKSFQSLLLKRKKREQLLNKIKEIKLKIASDWQSNNILLNKNKIFRIVNRFEDLNKLEASEFKQAFKEFDFNSKSILVVNGLDFQTYSDNWVVKGSGYWIKNLEIVNNKINIEFEYKHIEPKENQLIAVSPSLGFSSTTHFVIVDKINNLDNYQFNITQL